MEPDLGKIKNTGNIEQILKTILKNVSVISPHVERTNCTFNMMALFNKECSVFFFSDTVTLKLLDFFSLTESSQKRIHGTDVTSL